MKPLACGGKFTRYTVEHDVQFARDCGVLRLESAQFISGDYRDLPETQFLDAVPAKFRGDGLTKGSGIRPGTGSRHEHRRSSTAAPSAVRRARTSWSRTTTPG